MVMPTGRSTPARRQAGMLTADLVVSLAIVVLVLIPISAGIYAEAKLCRAYYHDAVAMGVVDGEMEVLAAGEWRSFGAGEHQYPTPAKAAKNLPPGEFVLTRTDRLVRLEWRPRGRGEGHAIAREWRLP